MNETESKPVGKLLVFNFEAKVLGSRYEKKYVPVLRRLRIREMDDTPKNRVEPEPGASGRCEFTIFDLSTVPPTLILRQISLIEIRREGGKIPEFYFDEFGNLTEGKLDNVIMPGPDSFVKITKP